MSRNSSDLPERPFKRLPFEADETPGDGMSEVEAKRRKEAALAETRELELARLKGEMINAADASHAWSEILTAVKSAMLSIPDEIAETLALMEDPRVVKQYLTRRIRRKLEDTVDGLNS